VSNFDRAGRVARRIALGGAGYRKLLRLAERVSRDGLLSIVFETSGFLSFLILSGGRSTSPIFLFVFAGRLLRQLFLCGFNSRPAHGAPRFGAMSQTSSSARHPNGP
jgi:hypothetical protein